MTTYQETFTTWDNVYKSLEVESMNWYHEDLDADLEEDLQKRKIATGRFLDVGTGPATQAFEIVKRGFRVTGSDISETAIDRAKKLQRKHHYYCYKDSLSNNNISFVVDDILKSKMKDSSFDYIFDRGCFHIISSRHRQKYVAETERILDNKGILFLKCLSIKDPFVYVLDSFRIKKQEHQKEEKEGVGPCKFSENQIKDIFGKRFVILTIKDTVIQGISKPLPRALFIVMKKR
jgi:SAM-dependent methyltransferase